MDCQQVQYLHEAPCLFSFPFLLFSPLNSIFLFIFSFWFNLFVYSCLNNVSDVRKLLLVTGCTYYTIMDLLPVEYAVLLTRKSDTDRGEVVLSASGIAYNNRLYNNILYT
jgi:hypothetical protein